jgi:Tol biopolymer transport system component
VRDREILDSIAEAILTGTQVDWDDGAADSSPELRALLRELRVVAGIAELHRSMTPRPASSSTSAIPEAPSNDDITRWPSAVPWGPLRLLEPVGSGASGVVYRAWDTRLDREVALKLLHERPLEDGAAIEEGRLLARLRHSNVVTVHGAENYGGRAGIWMEFVQGQTLEDRLVARGPLDWPEACALGVTICRALQAVHDAGLLHRDLKTHNVMQEPSGRVVVMDFHASRRTGAPDASEIVGTPLFLAPEVLLDRRPASVRSDVYSAGVLVYRLLTAAYPVEGATLHTLQRAFRRGPVASVRGRRPSLPQELIQAVDSAIHPNPDNRPRTAEDFAARLERAIASPVDRPESRRARLAFWVPVSALTIGCAVAVATLWPAPTMPGGLSGLLGGPSSHRGGPAMPLQAPGALLTMAQLDWGSFVPVNGPTADGTAIAGLVGQEPAVRNLTTGEVRVLQQRVHEDDGAGTPAISPDRQSVAYTWYRWDGKTHHVEVRIAPFEGGPWRRVLADPHVTDARISGWTPDGDALVATVSHADRSSAISLVDVASGNVRPVRRFADAPPMRAVMSPAGSVIAYDIADADDTARRDVHLIDVRTGSERGLIAARTNDLWPCWSADGRTLTFASDRGGSLALWAVEISGTQATGPPRQIKSNMGRFRPLGFTRDDDLYFVVLTGAMDVYRVTLDRLGEVVSTPTAIAETFVGQNLDGDWSPSGDHVTYVSRRGEVPFERGSMTLVVRDLAAGTERRFTPDVDGIHDPTWTPDGEAILFGGRTGDNDRLYRLSLVDGTVRPLDPAPLIRAPLSWSADGARLYGVMSRDGRWSAAVRDMATGHEREIAWPTNMVTAISRDERWLATTRVDPGPGGPVIAVWSMGSRQWRDVFRANAGDRVFPLGWTPDGELLFWRTTAEPTGVAVTEVWGVELSGAAASTRRLGLVSGFASPRKFRLRHDGRELMFTAGNPAVSPWVLRGLAP